MGSWQLKAKVRDAYCTCPVLPTSFCFIDGSFEGLMIESVLRHCQRGREMGGVSYREERPQIRNSISGILSLNFREGYRPDCAIKRRRRFSIILAP